MHRDSGIYILATGEKDVERLRILNQVYGPGTESLLRRAGLKEGMRVVEIGCGSGNVTCWIAAQVGPGGSVVGIDRSPEQIEQASRQAAAHDVNNVRFLVADAATTGLPAGSFDLAYCRLVLMHLKRPLEALRAMRDLVRPGGLVVAEEMDLTHGFCDPPAPALARFVELNLALGERRGENFRLGSCLHRLFRDAGLSQPAVSANYPFALQGESKRLLGLSFREFAPALIAERLATQSETDQLAADLMRLADDSTTLFAFPLIVQVIARKPDR